MTLESNGNGVFYTPYLLKTEELEASLGQIVLDWSV